MLSPSSPPLSTWDQIREKLSLSFLYIFHFSALALISLYHHRMIDEVASLTLGMIILGILTSVCSRLRYQKKINFVDGLNRRDDEVLNTSWIDMIGDRGIASMNLSLFLIVFPLFFASSFSLGWGLFTPINGLIDSLNFMDWSFFLFVQCVEPLALLARHLNLTLIENHAQLEAALTPIGSISLTLFNLLILSLLLDVFTRYFSLRNTLERMMSAIRESARSLAEFEVHALTALKHIPPSEDDYEARDHQRALLVSHHERAQDLLSKQRSLTSLLAIFPRGSLLKAVGRFIEHDTFILKESPAGDLALGRATALTALSVAAQRPRSHRGRAAYKLRLTTSALALKILKTPYPPSMRGAALYALSTRYCDGPMRVMEELTPQERDQLIALTKELLHSAAAQSASVEGGIDYERLTLASAYTLIAHQQIKYLEIIIGLLRSQSMLLRAESGALYQQIIQRSGQSDQRLLNLVGVLLANAERRNGVEIEESISALKKELKLRNLIEKSTGETPSLPMMNTPSTPLESSPWTHDHYHSFVISAMMSCIGEDFNRPQWVKLALALLKYCDPYRVSSALWALLMRVDLPLNVQREILEGIQVSPDLRRATLDHIIYATNYGRSRERERSAYIFGQIPYDIWVHDRFYATLDTTLKSLSAEITLQDPHAQSACFSLLCAFGKLCSQDLSPKLRAKSLLRLSDTFYPAKLEMARLYARAHLGEATSYLQIFECALGHRDPETGTSRWGEDEISAAREVLALDDPLTFEIALEVFEVAQVADSIYHHSPLPQIKRGMRDRTLFGSGERQRRRGLERTFDLALKQYRADFEAIGIPMSGQRRLESGEHDVQKTSKSPQTMSLLSWVTDLSDHLITCPSALGMLLLIHLSGDLYPIDLRRKALVRLKTLNRFLSPSQLGPLSDSSSEDWIAYYLRQMIEIEHDSRATKAMVRLLGTLGRRETDQTLWGILSDPDDRYSAEVRSVSAVAIGRKRDSAELIRLIEAYSQEPRVTVRAAIVRAMTEIQSDRALLFLSEEQLDLPNTDAIDRTIKRFQELRELQELTPLFERIETLHLTAQERLLKAYAETRAHSPNSLEGSALLEAPMISKLYQLCREYLFSPSPVKEGLVRASILTLGWVGSRDDEALYEVLFERLNSTSQNIQLMELSSTLTLCYQADYIEHLKRVFYDQSFNANIHQKSMIIAGLKYSDHPDMFIEMASAHLSDHAAHINPQAINILSAPYLKYAKRLAIPHIKFFIENMNPAYSPTIAKIVGEYGDPFADQYWVQGLYDRVQDLRLRGKTDLVNLEVSLLNTLWAFNKVEALIELIRLSFLRPTNRVEAELSAEAQNRIKHIDLQEVLSVWRDEED